MKSYRYDDKYDSTHLCLKKWLRAKFERRLFLISFCTFADSRSIRDEIQTISHVFNASYVYILAQMINRVREKNGRISKLLFTVSRAKYNDGDTYVAYARELYDVVIIIIKTAYSRLNSLNDNDYDDERT